MAKSVPTWRFSPGAREQAAREESPLSPITIMAAHAYFWVHPVGHCPGRPLPSRLSPRIRVAGLHVTTAHKVEVCFFLVSKAPFSDQGLR